MSNSNNQTNTNSLTNNSKISCDLLNKKIIGKGVDGTVYDLGKSIVKKIDLNNKNIKKIKWELKAMIKVSNDPGFPTIYGAKICNSESNKSKPYILIKMEKFDYTMTDWMKEDHTVEEWHSVYKQLFQIIDRANTKYRLSIDDIKPDNLMFKNDKLKIIDLGINSSYNGKQFDYINMTSLYCDKYGVNLYTISEELLKRGYNRAKAWKIANSYDQSEKLFRSGVLDINKIKKWEYPDKIIPMIKRLKADYGKPASYFLDKYFPTIE